VDTAGYPTRSHGIFTAAFLGKAAFTRDGLLENQYGGDVGLSLWVTANLRLVAEYAPSVDDVPSQLVRGTLIPYHQIAQAVSLTASARFR